MSRSTRPRYIGLWQKPNSSAQQMAQALEETSRYGLRPGPYDAANYPKKVLVRIHWMAFISLLYPQYLVALADSHPSPLSFGTFRFLSLLDIFPDFLYWTLLPKSGAQAVSPPMLVLPTTNIVPVIFTSRFQPASASGDYRYLSSPEARLHSMHRLQVQRPLTHSWVQALWVAAEIGISGTTVVICSRCMLIFFKSSSLFHLYHNFTPCPSVRLRAADLRPP